MNQDAQHALSLLEEHGPRLHALLLRITLREDASEDLMQELFLRLSRRQTLARADDRVGYAVKTATRLAFDWRRTQRRRRDSATIVVEPADGAATASQRLDEREDLEAVLDAIQRLPTPARVVIVMRYLENRPYDEIAQALNRSVHHTRAVCHKALVRLRRMTTRPIASSLGGASHDA